MKSLDFLEAAYRCPVDGRWVGEPVDPALNPGTGVALARVPCMGGEMAEEAVNVAGHAFGLWSTVTAGEFARPLHWVKESGLGREGSRQGIEEYADLKYILVGGLQ